MSQRSSGYAKKENGAYYTPEWVTEVLVPHIPADIRHVWEPAAGSGKMVKVLEPHFASVGASDIEDGTDFLQQKKSMAEAIITNPPFHLAQEFIEHALDLVRPDGYVAMLLRTDFDHAKTRQHLFRNHHAFCQKISLLRRIRWFENTTGSPSYNHAWFCWDYKHQGWPRITYGP
jgi:hypothetical protein